MNSTSKNAENKTVNNPGIAAKFIILSLIGIFVFFVKGNILKRKSTCGGRLCGQGIFN